MIKEIKDLEKLLKLLRKQGVTEFKFDQLDLKLGELPRDPKSNDQGSDDIDSHIEPTDEELMNWSVRNLEGGS